MSGEVERPQTEAGIIEKGGHVSGDTAVSALGQFPGVLTKPAMWTAPQPAEPAAQPAPAPAPAPAAESE